MLADPRVLRLASAVGLLSVLAAWVIALLLGSVDRVVLVVLAFGAFTAGHLLMHAVRAVPAAILTALLGVACVGLAVSGRELAGPGAWLVLTVLSAWVGWTCVGPRGIDDRRRAAVGG